MKAIDAVMMMRAIDAVLLSLVGYITLRATVIVRRKQRAAERLNIRKKVSRSRQ